jgi:hypothetical protein
VTGVSVEFIREAALLRSLKHDNCVRLDEVFVTPSSIFLVLELCSCNLREHLREVEAGGSESMEEDALRRTAHQLLSALSYFHKMGLMHRCCMVDRTTKCIAFDRSCQRGSKSFNLRDSGYCFQDMESNKHSELSGAG